MEDDAFFTAQGANGSDVLNHTDFIVDKHDTDQNRVRADRGFEHIQIQQTISLYVKISCIKPLTLQLTESVEHGLVLGLHGDEVLAFCLVELRRTLDGQIVGLSRAAGPDNLTWVSANQVSDLPTRFFNSGLGFPTPGVAARGGIAEMLT